MIRRTQRLSVPNVVDVSAQGAIHVKSSAMNRVEIVYFRSTMLSCLARNNIKCFLFLGKVPSFIVFCSAADQMDSYQMDKLDEIRCRQLVVRDLPDCEHTAELECSDDPSQHRCTKRCDGIMSCCGRSCNSSCWKCQSQSSQARDDSGKVSRIKHMSHQCEKRLYCEHQCAEFCSENHQCTTSCKGPCRQVCAHTKCRNYCSTPCPPCQEPCTW